MKKTALVVLSRLWLLDKRLLLLLCLLFSAPIGVWSQAKKITGEVKDEKGNPIAGVSVMIKGTNKGTTTDELGRYAINAPMKSLISFSFVNYVEKTIIVDKESIYNLILLTRKDKDLDEVVVVGYGTVKRKDLTGAVGSVNMKDFAKAPVKSFDDALAGRVAGVVVQSNDGQPGSNANIVIRGAGSITQDQSPLYVVDGFPTETSNANSIAPSDIESIDILKDASATAIYGARGANGVVLITTKRGKSGPPVLTYNGYTGMQDLPKKMEMMGPYDFVSYISDLNPAFDSVYIKPPITLEDYKSVAKIDMQDLVFRTGKNQNHDIALRGGNDKTRYSLSFNVNNQDGVIINTGFKRYQGRFALDQTVSDKLKVGINANYSYAQSFGPQVSATNFYASAVVLYSVWGWRPTNSLANGDSTSDLNNDFYDALNSTNTAQDYRVNPSINLQHMQNTTSTTTFVANGYAEYAFTPHLKVRVSGGLTRPVIDNTYFNDTLTQSGSAWGSLRANGGITTNRTTTYLNDNILTYSNIFNKIHQLTVMAGTSLQGNNNYANSISATQLPNPDLGLDGLDLAANTNTTIAISHSTNRLISGIARINYAYDSRYLLTASVRADGSSKFAAGHRWGYFPSAAFAWNFNKENFAKNWSTLSTGKLRLGYGASGNNRVSDFAYLSTLLLNSTNYQATYSYNNQPPAIGAMLSTAGNPDLSWETSKQTNVGLDLGFFKDRINLTVDAYKRKVDNLLLNASLPYTSGIVSATGYKNVGNMQNKGLEFTLSTVNIVTRKFTWSSNFNIAFNKNEILSLTEGQTALLSGSGTFFNTTYSTLSPYISAIGRPLGEMYGLIWNGVYQYSDFNQMPNGSYVLKNGIPDNGTGRTNVKPGDIKYKDINGDGTINNKDWTVIGSGLPKYTGGFSNNFLYGNFDLNVLLQWSVGNDVINANRYIFEGGILANPSLNQMANYANRWSPTNPSNTLFRAGGFGNAAYSSRVVEDGSYLKLRTVSLGYNFSSKVLNTIHIKNIRAYVSAQNLITWTNYSGLDPESSSRQSNLTPGFDYAAYPHSLSIVFGLNVTF